MLTSSLVSFRCSWCMRLSQCVQRATYHAPPKSTWIFFLTFHGFVHLINSYYYENTFQRCLRLTLKNETKNWQILSYDEICRQITRHSQKIYNMVIYKRSICICICQPSWKIPDWQRRAEARNTRRERTKRRNSPAAEWAVPVASDWRCQEESDASCIDSDSFAYPSVKQSSNSFLATSTLVWCWSVDWARS